MTDFNLDDLLADILHDSKPLPTAAPTAIIAAPQPEAKEEVSSLLTLGPPLTEPTEVCAPAPAPATTIEDIIGQPMSGQLDAFPAQMPEAPQPEAAPDSTDYTLPPMPVPTFTSDEIASTLDLRNFATMTTLNTNRWHAKVKDRKASHDAAVANDADEAAFATRTRLLAGADPELKATHKAIATARAKYYAMTLPWTTTGLEDVGRRSGARIMPNTQFFEFVTEMGNCKAEMIAALDKFVPLYPQLVQEAQKKHGKRFDPTEYHSAEAIRSYFDLTFDFMPIPEGSDFKGLPQQQCDALANALQSKTRQMVENAMQDLWVRAHEAIGRMAERLSHPDKLFHYTLVDNVRQVSNQLKHLNVTDDPRIRDLQQYVEQYLTKHDVYELRKQPVLRAQVGAYAQDALEKMRRIATATP